MQQANDENENMVKTNTATFFENRRGLEDREFCGVL